MLYAYTPAQKVIALDAATGKLLWKFDRGSRQPSRIVASHSGEMAGKSGFRRRDELHLCARPEDRQGHLQLRRERPHRSAQGPRPRSGPPIDCAKQPRCALSRSAHCGRNKPETLPAPPGDIRAYSVRTGALRWSFHTIPHPGELGYNTWPKDAWKFSGAANNWGGMAVDTNRGIVYAPTGSAAPDFYGASRIGDDLFANCLLALDANTGKLLWYFQGVHHDIWDRDFPAPPMLVTIRRGAQNIPAIAQTTKQGYLYLFNRVTGKPLYPIEERPYPPSTVPGEVASSHQPFPTAPEPFARQQVTEDTLTTRTPEAHAWALKRLHELRSEGEFVPLSIGKDTILPPSFEGGGEWGGPAEDPESDVLYVNANNYASMGALAEVSSGPAGRTLYTQPMRYLSRRASYRSGFRIPLAAQDHR